MKLIEFLNVLKANTTIYLTVNDKQIISENFSLPIGPLVKYYNYLISSIELIGISECIVFLQDDK